MRSLRQLGAIAGSVVTVLAVSACDALGGEPDVSPQGQVEYACALAEFASDEYGDPAEWEGLIGADAHPGVVVVSGAAGLLGGFSGYAPPEHPELAEAAREIVTGLGQADLEMVSAGLDDVVAACDGLTETGAAVEPGDRAEYACALTDRVIEAGDVESWGPLIADPSWLEVTGVVGLLGGWTNSALDGHEELSAIGADLAAAIARVDFAEIQTLLAEVTAACEEL